MNIPRIVILGGGYAGLLAAYRLAGKVGTGAEITLVDGKAHFVERIRLHQWAARQDVRQRAYTEMLKGKPIRFEQGWVSAIDAAGKHLALRTATGDRTLPYNFLVYAPGSTTDKWSVPGVAEHAYAVGDEKEATRLRGRLAELSKDGGSVVVVGGGLTGIESATELAERYPALRVRLVTRGRLGEGLSEKGRAHVRQAMARLGVQADEQVNVRAVHAGHVEEEKGGVIPSDLTVWTGSFRAAPLAKEAGLVVNGRGQILVDEQLRSVSHPNIYAVGDAADLSRAIETPIRMACATAMPMGAYAASHLSAALKGERAPGAFRFAYVVQCISLGRRDGLVQVVDGNDRPRERVITGRAAALVKELICRYTVFGLHQERLAPGTFVYPTPGRGSKRLEPLTR